MMYTREDLITACRFGTVVGIGIGLLTYPLLYSLIEWAFFT